MDTPLTRAIQRLAGRAPLGETLAHDAFGQIMRGKGNPAQSAALLMGLSVRGETAGELAGAVRALRGAMVRIDPPERAHLIDTCGTGGGSVSTFNISTAAALVAVGAGASVAKHGNRSYTSQCGSADVLEALGVDISLDAADAERLLAHAGMTFLFAPAFHPAMRHIAPIRRALAVPTIMNLIGPLANPAGVTRQVIGVADPDRAGLIAEAAGALGAERVLVVHGTVGMDEIAPAGPTQVWEVTDDGLRTWTIDPSDHGWSDLDYSALAGGSPAANARRIERLLHEPRQDPTGRAAVLLNAGAAVYVAGLESSFAEGLERASAALDDGRAAAVLAGLRRFAGVSTSA